MSDIVTVLRNIVGPIGVLTGGDVSMRPASWLRQVPTEALAIVRPANTDELSRVMQACHAAGQVVVPLGEKSGLLAADTNHDAACRLLEQLSHSFQLVILDVGSMVTAASSWFIEPTSSFINTGLVVQDVRKTSAAQVDDLRNRLVQHGIDEVCIVENFHDQTGSPQPTPPPKLIR